MYKNKALQNERKNIFFRKTIKDTSIAEGVGLHSGEITKLIFHPAEEHTGIQFHTYLKNNRVNKIAATLENVMDTSMAVTLGKNHMYIQTIEHLMFAISILGITDMVIEVIGGSEIPILDGSAQPYIEILENCEFHEYSSIVSPIEIKSPIMVTDGDRYIVGIPANQLKISYSVDYNHPMLKNLSCEINYTREFFVNHIAKARTFGFMKDVEILRNKGLAQGGTIDNVLVFNQNSTVNKERFLHEALYHKVLDLMGDLSLCNRPIKGHLLGSKGGHALDIAFAKKLIKQSQEYDHQTNIPIVKELSF
ncbi:MAG: UDP-3-O-acyl-N-acetylglucosamine deacetylase [Spirochaetia bacterium]|nr:UDP-3-O-acyl-N-acetylglucosamine deacetylase [Spirochaetia bacterium]